MTRFARASLRLFVLCAFAFSTLLLRAETKMEADPPRPGDAMIDAYLKQEADKIRTNFFGDIKTQEDWEKAKPEWRREYFEMLGLSPMPEKTPLHATVTRTLNKSDFAVEMLHFQSRPGLYVTCNFYRPASQSTAKLPTVLYLCGHSTRGRNGNKTAYQSHGMWFARHGYNCLIVDTLQMGEIAGIHHGTYASNYWWWVSRGYTPAGVECWNGIRAIDYLLTRGDVDPDNIGVTGISGGGAATFWITAADDRVKIAAPVSGFGDLEAYIDGECINNHCDCMFMDNVYEWPWTRIPALVAPRPLLFVNSDHDSLFPMDSNERVINRLKRVYSLFGASDDVQCAISIGKHEYRKDIRQAVYRFFNEHFKNDSRIVQDSEVDLVIDPKEKGKDITHPIPPEQLRVFPTDDDIPNDAINKRIAETFVPLGHLTGKEALAGLRNLTFHNFPETVPAAKLKDRELTQTAAGDFIAETLETESPLCATLLKPKPAPEQPRKIILVVTDSNVVTMPSWLGTAKASTIYFLQPRGVGATRWTDKSPPNYVKRSMVLLGRTVDSGRVWDTIATARYLSEKYKVPVTVAGEKGNAVLAACAAALDPKIAGVLSHDAPQSLMETNASCLLNALRVCDVPEIFQLVAPRPVSRL